MTALRAAGPEDLAAIMAIERSSFPTDAWTDGMMRATLTDPDTLATAAVDGDVLVGYAAVLAPRGGDADVLTIAVTEAARGRGIGRALLERLIAAATARGARRVFLEVRADNPVATALYASAGFAAVGRRPHYYQPDDVDAVVMRLELPEPAAVR
ncbi:MAG: ribosomal protein S18-alanine N-acetyltransferase [Amnibacterium sp.]